MQTPQENQLPTKQQQTRKLLQFKPCIAKTSTIRLDNFLSLFNNTMKLK
ncbi:hypothetical protein NBRC116595_37560 [Aliiglaciecola sp. NS0011-25]